jgi:O-6-methylguanine DNA methyltransferase
VVVGIARGKTKSYREVAVLAGRPLAYRAVGNIMAKNHNPKIPCHRVIRSNGSPGGYARGSRTKVKILLKER